MIKVIGAGLPRTATTTQLVALEQLGFAPCYHMRDLLADLEAGLPLWERVAEGDPDWERIFGDSASTVDWPSARYYRELMDYYPEAKVLLSVRDGESWAHSMQETVWGIFHGDSVIHHVSEARAALDPRWRAYTDADGPHHLAGGRSAGRRHVDGRRSDRGDGPLERHGQGDACPPSGCSSGTPPTAGSRCVASSASPVPAEPLPRLNTTASFREGIIGDALAVVNDWWAKARAPRQRTARGARSAERRGPRPTRRPQPATGESSRDRGGGGEHHAPFVERLHGDEWLGPGRAMAVSKPLRATVSAGCSCWGEGPASRRQAVVRVSPFQLA